MRNSVVCAAVIGTSLLAGTEPENEERPPFWNVMLAAVEQETVQAEFEEVLEHMRGIGARRSRVANRLQVVNSGLAEPWTVPALAGELRDLLALPCADAKGDMFWALGEGVADWLDLDAYEEPGPECEHEGLRELDAIWATVIDSERKGILLLQSLSDFVGGCHEVLEEALSGLDTDQQALLFTGHTEFCEAFYRDHFPGTELSEEQKLSISSFKTLLTRPRTNRGLVMGVASLVLRMGEPQFLNSLPRRLSRIKQDSAGDDFGKDLLAVVGDAPHKRVLLHGRRPSTHSAAAALSIDLGGDDTYERAAVVDTPEMLVSVVIDLGGDDSFGSVGPGGAMGPGPAYSAGGVALLVDRKGNDHYESKRLGQAATALGFAALVDLEGDDEYVAEDYAQGHAICGVGLLYDVEGDDTYSAWAFAQGGGIGYGMCALIDGGGDDTYLADLHWPDVYGNSGADVYHGASQGYSTGIRRDIAGGIAALLDLGEGKDRYQSGSFSQGGGYYFSFGLMFDGGGDDENFGSRYSQGFGVHQGLGVRWDAGGNDRYTCRSVAHTGMAWDEGVGYLLEDGGDDVYRTGDLSCGGAAQTGIAICLDRGGADSYKTGRQSQGGSGSSEYHKKPSVGVLIDLGGQQDEYSAEARGDSTLRVTNGVEVFLDVKAKNMRKALKAKELR